MANLKIEPDLPEIERRQALTGWHREFCVELLGDGVVRIFVRADRRGNGLRVGRVTPLRCSRCPWPTPRPHPRDAPLDMICCMGCAGITGIGAVLHTARVEALMETGDAQRVVIDF